MNTPTPAVRMSAAQAEPGARSCPAPATGEQRLPSGVAGRPWRKVARQHGWQAIFPLGLLGLIAVAVSDSAAQDVIYGIFSLVGAVALFFGLFPSRRYHPRAWVLIIAGIFIGQIGEMPLPLFLVPIPGSGNALTIGNVLNLSGYGLVVMAFFALVQDSRRNLYRLALIIDSAILIIGSALLYWLCFINLVADPHGVPLFVRISAALNPTLDILFLGVALRFLLTHHTLSRVNPTVVCLIVGANISALISDSGAAYTTLINVPVILTLVDGAGVAAWVFWTAFALHPDLFTMLHPADTPGQHLSYRRLLLLGLILILAPVAISVRWVLGDDSQIPLLVPFAAGLAVLIMARMVVIMATLQDSFAQQEILAGKLEEARVCDPLTGLANRYRLTDKLEELTINRRDAVLMLLDLDDFKAVNDTLGHAVGDAVIQLVGGRLKNLLPSAEMIARLGADKFAILLTDAGQMATMPDLASQIVAAMDEPVNFGGKLVQARLSIGIARVDEGRAPAMTGCPGETKPLESSGSEGVFELLRNAEIAMFLAKSRGKDRFEIFHPAMLDRMMAHAATLADLERAIEAGEIESYYQPIVNLRSGEIVAAEALARWQHPERGLVAPNEFIGLAESSGLILPLGNSLLEEACKQAMLWPANSSMKAPGLHANLTVRQLHSFGIVEMIARCLRVSGLDSSQLTLEVLESALVDDTARAVLWDIHALGVKLFIDDFGTGYSALGYLSSLPIDGIKIDRAFITTLSTDSRDHDILEGILGIARRLHLEVVAEGIETDEQRRALLGLHSFIGQGYLFSRAVPAAKFRDLLDRKQVIRRRAA